MAAERNKSRRTTKYVKLLSVPSEVDWTTQNQGKYAKGNGEKFSGSPPALLGL